MNIDPRLPNENVPGYQRLLRTRLFELFRDIYMRFNADGSLSPAKLSDAAAPNNSIYYSTDGNKLSYKSPSGSVHALY